MTEETKANGIKTEGSEAIKTENLTFIYSPETPFAKKALDGVNFTARKGEFVALIGHTGSGKSTLTQHLNGLLRPTAGRVFVNGRDIWEKPAEIRNVRFQVGLIFQYPEYQLFEETVALDIAFGPKNMGFTGEELDARVRAAAAFAGVPEEIMEKSPFELSGGQKRRVAIAGVLAMEPMMLILDEPTAGLDPRGQREILDGIVQYRNSRGGTVILVTHSMDAAARVADRIVVMNQGRILREGTPEQVFSEAENLEAAGLSVPLVTRVFLRLRQLGLPVNAAVRTVEEGKAELMSYRARQGRDSEEPLVRR